MTAYISYDNLSLPYQAFINAITKEPEPTCFTEAKKHKAWTGAMNEEISNMENTHTWDVTVLPPGKVAVGCKWVYKVKYLSDGSVERYRARLVAKGYTQKEGLDFVDTYSPVAKLSSVKLLLKVAAKLGWSLHQLDISNAFLNGELSEEIYMQLPPGYAYLKGEHLPNDAVLRLRKSIYGLKQASRQWFIKFADTLLLMGFTKTGHDHTLFTWIKDGVFVAVLVYVDDIIVASNNTEAAEMVKSQLKSYFKLRDLGDVKYFLGLEIARSKAGISICQRKYAMELLDGVGMLGCKPSSIPMEPNTKLSQESGELYTDIEGYRRLIGKLIYLTITRPDICFAVQKLAQYTSAPRIPHYQALLKLLRYIKGTIGQGLFYSASSSLHVKGFADADWGSCPDTRRSVGGYAIFVGDSLISWRSRKQKVVSRSSAEAEYRSLADGVCELVWIQNLLRDLHVNEDEVHVMYCDNTAANHIAHNPVFHERTKHIEMDCHITRDHINAGTLKLLHVRTDSQIADVLTKPVFPSQFKELIGKMGLINIFSQSSS